MFQNLKRAGILASSLSPFRFSGKQTVVLQTPYQPPHKTNPRLALRWPDGVQDSHDLCQADELTIGNVVIRRAKVRYYLERIDNAFPAFLNGQSINKAHLLRDGDVLQVGELETTFQLVA